LYERFLANCIRNEGIDFSNTAAGNANLGNFHYHLLDLQVTADTKRKQLRLAQGYYKVAKRIFTKLNGASHSQSKEFASTLTIIALELSEI
jgi:hypothetical protein